MLKITLGPYSIHRHSFYTLFSLLTNSIHNNISGFEKIDGATPEDIARRIVQNNATESLFLAGMENFRYMWVSDTGVSFKGLLEVVPVGRVKRYIQHMITMSAIKGAVQSCFTEQEGFNMPYRRADGLPWLIYMVSEYTHWSKSQELLENNREQLQQFLTNYEHDKFHHHLIKRKITGDWMDTILRPSSTWNNVCALMMLQRAKDMGFRLASSPEAVEEAILKDRFRETHLTEYMDSERIGIDAMVLAIYFQLFPVSIRKKFIEKITLFHLTDPMPMRTCLEPFEDAVVPTLTRLTKYYHNSIWLYIGLMYLNGLKNMGIDISDDKRKIDENIMYHRNFLEAFNPDGTVYKTPFQSSEVGLSMSAAQYLELVS